MGRAIAERGFEAFEARYRRPDGQYRTLVDTDGSILNDEAFLYDQAFALLAGSTLCREAHSLNLLTELEHRRTIQGGYRETGGQAFLSNPNMHLFEAALAWMDAGSSPRWGALADSLGNFAMRFLIDVERGFISEVYDENWRHTLRMPQGRIEPGHQFEWAWLLARWAKLSGPTAATNAARRLYEVGLMGIDHQRCVAIDAMAPTFEVSQASARLWPQTEWLKASVALGRPTDVLQAVRALSRYLEMPVQGLWRDKLTAEGQWVDEPVPASSLYHIAVAIQTLTAFQA
jgi:mannose-1-phosphate guanylyltransferase/mannose-6-phosphate isomerase